MAHFARFLRSPSPGLGILQYLDDVIFAAHTARESLSAAHALMHVLRRFGWLVHPTKFCGVSQAVQAFQALGTLVDLATQSVSVPLPRYGFFSTPRRLWLPALCRPRCG